MERPLPEILASQDEMLRRRGKSDATSHDLLTSAFKDHLREVSALLEKRDDMLVFRMGYRRLLQEPIAHANAVKDFLSLDLNVEAMAEQVDLSLYRNRCP